MKPSDRSTPIPVGIFLNPVAAWMWFALKTSDMLLTGRSAPGAADTASPPPEAPQQARPEVAQTAAKASRKAAKPKKSRGRR